MGSVTCVFVGFIVATKGQPDNGAVAFVLEYRSRTKSGLIKFVGYWSHCSVTVVLITPGAAPRQTPAMAAPTQVIPNSLLLIFDMLFFLF